jgi:hypothetical protein
MKVCEDISASVSSSCGWKTFTRKSSRNDVRVLMTMSELGGTTSFKRPRKSSDGGSKMPMLNTLGSTSSLCPVALPSRLALVSATLSSALFESDTRPGTDDLRINSRSSRSCAMSGDLVLMSASLNIRLVLSRGAREKALAANDCPCPLRYRALPSVAK